mmetsp:Transcript_8180/g.30175  ORF Transcript_8180/g.30175 Transcript_8180/m.30175 type:complete len:97 (-) Transcript_8180:1362-1652(-)
MKVRPSEVVAIRGYARNRVLEAGRSEHRSPALTLWQALERRVRQQGAAAHSELMQEAQQASAERAATMAQLEQVISQLQEEQAQTERRVSVSTLRL